MAIGRQYMTAYSFITYILDVFLKFSCPMANQNSEYL